MAVDVLVAGAGPAGLTMAAELARYGVSVRVIDKAAQRSDKSKALVVWSRTLELFDRMNCTAAFLAEGFPVTKASIVASGKPVGQIDLSKIASPYPFALMIPQNDTERLLENHLNTTGAHVERSVELMQFRSSADGVTATLRHADKQMETAEAQWLIACDGAHSTIRHELGVPFAGDTLPTNWILADVHASGVPTPGQIDIIWHADGVVVLFPIKQNRYRVIADVGDDPADANRPDPALADVQALLDDRGPGGIHLSDPIWLARFRINDRKVSDYRAGRVFLCGDAAHVHSPAGGQGMNTGIQDACNLAWKLALVCHGVCAEEPLLNSYSTERSAVGDQVLKAADRTTALAVLRSGIAQSIRNHVASLVFGIPLLRAALTAQMTEIAIGYPHSPLSVKHGHVANGPAAGERAPIREGEKPIGAGATPRFVLCAESDADGERLVALNPGLLDPEIRKPFHEGGLWLVRPDGYIALVTAGGKWEEVAAYLAQISKGMHETA